MLAKGFCQSLAIENIVWKFLFHSIDLSTEVAHLLIDADEGMFSRNLGPSTSISPCRYIHIHIHVYTHTGKFLPHSLIYIYIYIAYI